MLPVSRLILCPGLGYMQRPRAGTSHCSIQQESGSQPKPLNPCFIFGQQQKKTKTWSYKGTFPTWVIQPDVLDMFCLSVVESRGILLSVCFAVSVCFPDHMATQVSCCHNHNCYLYVGVIWVNIRPLCCFSRDSESCSLQSNPALHNGFQTCFIWLLTHLCWGNGW